MTSCDGTDYSETWCCGASNECCGTDAAITIPANIYVSPSLSPSSSTSPSPTSPPATTSSGSGAEPSPEQSPESSGLSTGAKAGIGVGVAAGVIVVLGFFAFFVIQRRRKKAAIAAGTFGGSAGLGAVPGVPQELPQTAVYEKPADKPNTRYELPAEQSTVADR